MKRLPPLGDALHRLPARMRKIMEVLRLAAQGLSTREVASSTGIGRTTLREYLYRARAAGLSWPLPDDLSDGDLERRLFPRIAGDVRGHYPQPDCLWGPTGHPWGTSTVIRRPLCRSARRAVASSH